MAAADSESSLEPPPRRKELWVPKETTEKAWVDETEGIFINFHVFSW